MGNYIVVWGIMLLLMWVQTMARRATCEGRTVVICTSLESSVHGGIGWII